MRIHCLRVVAEQRMVVVWRELYEFREQSQRKVEIECELVGYGACCIHIPSVVHVKVKIKFLGAGVSLCPAKFLIAALPYRIISLSIAVSIINRRPQFQLTHMSI